ncbi:MAG: FAD binding domain-containing protein [Rhodobacter sp.]|nr:FAD binding domain-containing protein [Rhodobacter sp.]MCY4241654.1 FAD binding domain-containing protein [Rhodobacter sp.]
MYALNFRKAASADDAVAKLAAAVDGRFLAGGQTLIPTIKQRLADPSDLISLAGAGLSGVSIAGTDVTVGAMMTHAEVAGDRTVQMNIPAVAALAAGIGDPAVRHRGTIGGSIANNDPAADYPAAVLGLGATVRTNRRAIAADDFFTGLFETALDADELIKGVTFPKAERSAYAKFPNPASRYAMVGVFVARNAGGVRVAVTGAGSNGVFRHAGLEAALSARFSPDAVDGVDVSSDDLMADIHGSADYRANLIKVMAKRAVAAA